MPWKSTVQGLQTRNCRTWGLLCTVFCMDANWEVIACVSKAIWCSPKVEPWLLCCLQFWEWLSMSHTACFGAKALVSYYPRNHLLTFFLSTVQNIRRLRLLCLTPPAIVPLPCWHASALERRQTLVCAAAFVRTRSGERTWMHESKLSLTPAAALNEESKAKAAVIQRWISFISCKHLIK